MSKKLWGEFEDDENDDNIQQTVNFNPIIELGMQNIPEIPITVKSSPIELPKSNLITHTIQLHAYSRQLNAILEQTENAVFEGARLDVMSLPTPPPELSTELEHESKPPINFLQKEYCDFSRGKGPVITPFTPESHKRALRQCAAIALGHIGITTCTNTALNAMADALDLYLNNMCKLMRTIVDREAGGIKSGFPDVMAKVFADLNVGNLHEFYQNRVIKYHAKMKRTCEDLKVQCESLALGELAQPLEEVPELHFPAALDDAFTPSLEPGFQMLQSLEQDQLQGLDILEAVTSDDIRVDHIDFSQPETVKISSLSPGARKKRK
ncbi:PREDICTED: STAGA complex 65 subunit gamma-like [Papilio xuthus]|uniref:STAGA complex 65 subunit gamma-like n=1 Tax=Papilio xuthus TaxID=66420 RepID=A0AAJ6Z0J1_PAPXU|nr:PREDICTED: STAGA complex 65 subunit gamma-like [Papilio xuthus]